MNTLCGWQLGKDLGRSCLKFQFVAVFQAGQVIGYWSVSSHLPYLETFYSSLQTNYILNMQGNGWWLFFRKYFPWLHFVSHVFQFIAEPAVVNLLGKYPVRSQISCLYKPLGGLLFSIELEMDWRAVKWTLKQSLEVNLVWKVIVTGKNDRPFMTSVAVFPVWKPLAISIWISLN